MRAQRSLGEWPQHARRVRVDLGDELGERRAAPSLRAPRRRDPRASCGVRCTRAASRARRRSPGRAPAAASRAGVRAASRATRGRGPCRPRRDRSGSCPGPATMSADDRRVAVLEAEVARRRARACSTHVIVLVRASRRRRARARSSRGRRAASRCQRVGRDRHAQRRRAPSRRRRDRRGGASSTHGRDRRPPRERRDPGSPADRGTAIRDRPRADGPLVGSDQVHIGVGGRRERGRSQRKHANPRRNRDQRVGTGHARERGQLCAPARTAASTRRFTHC